MAAQPRASSACANAIVWSMSHPPSTQSVPDTRIVTAWSAGKAARTASTELRGALGRRSEGFTHPREALSVEGDRRVLAVLVRDRRRRDRLPAVCMIGCDLHPFPRYLRRGLATGVRQLNGNLHVGPAAD